MIDPRDLYLLTGGMIAILGSGFIYWTIWYEKRLRAKAKR